MGEFLGDWTVQPSGLAYPERKAVRMLLLGEPEPIIVTINDLYRCNFCEPHVWSRPLRPPQTGEAIGLQPGEVMRIYKRYLTLR